MKEEIAKLWVEALRSEVFEQAKGKLKDSNGYCCLGVLCHISELSSWEQDTLSNSEDYSYLRNTQLLPEAVMVWAGMESVNGQFYNEPESRYSKQLDEMNDSGLTFNQIADEIEKHWKIL